MTSEAKTAAARLDWRTLMSATEDTPAGTIKALDAYFEPFAQPVYSADGAEKPMLCLECNEPLTGMLASMFGKGGFTWGIAHGEGYCRGCSWPARALHYIKDADGKDVCTIRNVILQYHPDFVSKRA